MIELSIVVVSYNTRTLTQECLSSLYSSLHSSNLESVVEVILIDNHSIDNTESMVKNIFPQVVIIKNTQNLGFANATNQGINKARGKYILLLNSDTKVKKDSVLLTLEKIKNNPQIGVLGCKLLNIDGTVQQSCGYFPSIFKVFLWLSFIDDLPLINRIIKPYHVTNRNFYNYEHEVDWVTGAYFLFRKEIIKTAGFFDPQVFMYVEEVEYCYRIRKQGFKIIYTPLASIYHMKGASGGGKEAGIIAEFEGITYFYKKHYSRFSQSVITRLIRCGALLRVMIFGIIGNSEKKRIIYKKFLKMAR